MPPHRRSLSEVARQCGITRQAISQTAARHEWETRISRDTPNILAAISRKLYEDSPFFDPAFLASLEEDPLAGLDLEEDPLAGFDLGPDPFADLNLG